MPIVLQLNVVRPTIASTSLKLNILYSSIFTIYIMPTINICAWILNNYCREIWSTQDRNISNFFPDHRRVSEEQPDPILEPSKTEGSAWDNSENNDWPVLDRGLAPLQPWGVWLLERRAVHRPRSGEIVLFKKLSNFIFYFSY